jgi:hypothetical protein
MDDLWTPTRVNAIWIGVVICAFVAALVGISYGAWAIFQPFPQTEIGPVSAYVIGAGVLCLVAGWQIGKRALMIEKGYGDPGWTVPVILVALAAGCMGIWSASLAASVHTPEASAKKSANAEGAPPSSQVNEQVENYCAGTAAGNLAACAALRQDDSNALYGAYMDSQRNCEDKHGYAVESPKAGQDYSACQLRLYGDGSVGGIKARDQAVVKRNCEIKYALVQQGCGELLLRFVNSGSSEPFVP